MNSKGCRIQSIAVCLVVRNSKNLWQLFMKQKYCKTWDFRGSYVLKPENRLYDMSINFTERGLIKTELFEYEKSQNILSKEQTHRRICSKIPHVPRWSCKSWVSSTPSVSLKANVILESEITNMAVTHFFGLIFCLPKGSLQCEYVP